MFEQGIYLQDVRRSYTYENVTFNELELNIEVSISKISLVFFAVLEALHC